MNPNHKGRPLGVWSNPVSRKVDASALNPLRGSTDFKPGSRVFVASVDDRTARKTPVPAPVRTNRMPDAAALVPDAAAILDEEMAAGILAAYDARVPGAGSSKVKDGIGGRSADEWLRELHNLVDALGDVLPRFQRNAANALDTTAGVARRLEYESVPVLCPHAPVRAGDRARISMKLNNDDVNPARVALLCTDLFSTSGARIAQQQATVTPNELQLEPDAYAEVALEITIPSGCRPGAYSGLLLTSGLSYLRAVIAIEVV